ncbi:MAG TPA: hypothetical protein VK689_07850, partial [Armatimonadota bacterium]|nr:hypothetical protein [Armatimonadota bacterium]
MNNMEFWGEFETHITLRLHDQHVAALQEWGAGRGLKCIHILLNRGDHVSQPMLTRRSTGGLSGQLD